MSLRQKSRTTKSLVSFHLVSNEEALEIPRRTSRCVRCAQQFAVMTAEPCGSQTPFVDNMIRERVGIRGEIRKLEPFDELGAGSLIPAEIGVVKANMVARLSVSSFHLVELEADFVRSLEGRLEWSRRFPGEIEKVANVRARLEKDWKSENDEISIKMENDNIPLSAIAGRCDTVGSLNTSWRTTR